MTRLQIVLWALVVLTIIHENETATPVFLQAITSALGTIPFTAGPLSTGLVGAKLAVGSKLLYYLGFFGRRRSKPKSAPARTTQKAKTNLRSNTFPGGMQAVPMPYAFGGGGFPQQFGGFNQPGFGQYPYGYDPAQLFQILAAQGIDPNTAMQMMNFNGGAGSPFPAGGGGAVPASQFPFPAGGAVPASHFPFPTGAAEGPGLTPAGAGPGISQSFNENAGGEADEDIESFFTFLRDMDDNTCISRLMCDIGANPSFLGDFSENIHGIIGSLDVTPSSGAFPYLQIMESGRHDGGCDNKFHQCSDAAYEIVKNVAPSVGVPQNINSEAVNRLQ